MRNNLEDLTIADLKALHDLVGAKIKTSVPRNDIERHWHDSFAEVKLELNRRVEHIFGKP